MFVCVQNISGIFSECSNKWRSKCDNHWASRNCGACSGGVSNYYVVINQYQKEMLVWHFNAQNCNKWSFSYTLLVRFHWIVFPFASLNAVLTLFSYSCQRHYRTLRFDWYRFISTRAFGTSASWNSKSGSLVLRVQRGKLLLPTTLYKVQVHSPLS